MYYFSALRGILSKAHAMVLSDLLPVVQRALPHDARHDAGTDDPEVKATLDEIARKFARQFPGLKLQALAQEIAKRTSDFQKAQLFRQVKESIGVDPLILDPGLGQAIAAFTKDNVARIKSLPETYFADVEQRVIEGVRAGARASSIAEGMEEAYGVSESRAQLIANTEVGSFFGELNDTRLQDLGVSTAVWRTSRDGRVRDSHQDLEGESYDLGVGLYDKQLDETVLPGQAPNCRCDCEPDFGGLLGG